jgi:hypothetical protein
MLMRLSNTKMQGAAGSTPSDSSVSGLRNAVADRRLDYRKGRFSGAGLVVSDVSGQYLLVGPMRM